MMPGDIIFAQVIYLPLFSFFHVYDPHKISVTSDIIVDLLSGSCMGILRKCPCSTPLHI